MRPIGRQIGQPHGFLSGQRVGAGQHGIPRFFQQCRSAQPVMVDRLARVNHVDLTAVHHLDLIRPTDLHDDGSPRRVGGFESGGRGRRQQSGHNAHRHRHGRLGKL